MHSVNDLLSIYYHLLRGSKLWFEDYYYKTFWVGRLHIMVRVNFSKNGHSNEIYWAVLGCGAASVLYVLRGSYTLGVSGWNRKILSFKWKLVEVSSCGVVCHAAHCFLAFESKIHPVFTQRKKKTEDKRQHSRVSSQDFWHFRADKG